MRLFEIPRNSKLKLSVSKGVEPFEEKVVTFHHTDGMYSYCTVDDWEENNVLHVGVMQPMKLVDGYYVLASEEEAEADDLPIKDIKDE
jgi:hypothetical protein